MSILIAFLCDLLWMVGKKSNQRQTKKDNMLAKKEKPCLISLNGILLYLYFETEMKMLSSTSVSAITLHNMETKSRFAPVA